VNDSPYLAAMAKARRVTAKYRAYGRLYDLVAATMPPDPTVLEVGIANGGSLQTWRNLFGPGARIVGVDLNPQARVLEDEGFEIFLLDTGLPESWKQLDEHMHRQVHLLVDDGGHTNRQQISAILHGIDLVIDGGWLVIEDLHASFMGEFGNPSPYSTVRFLNELSADLHRRHPRSDADPRHPNLAASVQSVVLGTSWAGLRVDRRLDGSTDELWAGTDDTLMDYDHRWDASFGRLPGRLTAAIRSRYTGLVASPWARRTFRGDGPDPR
jgi:hypothetical protein